MGSSVYLRIVYMICCGFLVCGYPPEIFNKSYEYIQCGDINIGAVLSIHMSEDNRNCGQSIPLFPSIEYVQAVIFAINEINNRTDILPNVTLGTVILDDCLMPSMVLARAMQFMPDLHNFQNHCPSPPCFDRTNETIPTFYDVVSVIGSYTSSLSIVLANVLALFKIPQISHTSTSDLLSDKKRFPYFLRMVPPDKYQVKVIVDMLHFFNWKYVSVIYSEGSYGQESERQLIKLFRELDICVAQSIEIRNSMGNSQYDSVIDSLRKYKGARAVVLYADSVHAASVIKAAKRKNAFREFLWTGSDALSLILDDDSEYCNSSLGSLSVRPFSANVPRFSKYMKSLRETGLFHGKHRVEKDVQSWLPYNVTSGKFTEPEMERSSLHQSTEDDNYVPIFAASYVIDAVYAFAYALHDYINMNCGDLKGKAVRQCIQGEGLLNALKKVTFNSSIGEISFDQNGDVVGKYEIRQCQMVEGTPHHEQVGMWDMKTHALSIDKDKLRWSEFKKSSTGNYSDNDHSIPESVCAEPCISGQIYSFSRETCCWKCVSCKNNEIASVNSTHCETCELLFWPDERTRSRCVEIVPSYVTLADLIACSVCICAILGLIVALFVVMLFHTYRHERIIRSSSRELSQVMLVGISVAFMLVFSFLSVPNSVSCYLNHVGFSLTFTFVYAPLLVKTNRIYRIFRAGRKTTALPQCTSPTSQVAIVTGIIFIQILIIILSTTMSPPTVKLRMPIRTEKFVELYCDMPLAGLLSSLSFNLFLVMICTFYAFKTRKLPDNYNESRYIAFCVDTTLLVWISFVPTYFTTSRAYYKVIILSLALIVNSVVSLMCLFVPKLYALYHQKHQKAKSQDKCYNPLNIRTETTSLGVVNRFNNTTDFMKSRSVSQLVGSQDSATSMVSNAGIIRETKSESKLNGSTGQANTSSAENSDLSVT
ncbi:hypothetical protein SNE40_008103 [Patella caerulea]|uniref:G-protein coupled receptors family 3 profile domain-containing protein n=2 Tax=Patella caerulea TaxID=87958 RepID=A0AAN8Q3A4_PATCE